MKTYPHLVILFLSLSILGILFIAGTMVLNAGHIAINVEGAVTTGWFCILIGFFGSVICFAACGLVR